MAKVGVIGAGAIGCFVGGKLAAAGEDVVLVARERQKSELDAHGLSLEDMDLPRVDVRARVETDPAALADRDIVLCCVKSAATREAARQIARAVKPGTIVVSLQNGIKNPDDLRAELADATVLGGIVSFNVVSKGHGVYRRATTGPLVLEDLDQPRFDALVRALVGAGFEVERTKQIVAHQWAKLLFNLNNAVSALSNRPTREIVLSRGYRRILAAVVDEARAVLAKAGIRPARLGAFPVGVLVAALRLPTPVFRLVARAQLRIDPEARSSMWEDLEARKTTEVDWLNGEVVRLAARCGASAPMNARIVAIVHEAEKARAGSPGLSAEVLWERLSRSLI